MVWLGLDTKPTWLGKDDSSVQNTCIGRCYDPGLGETLAQQENEIPALPVPKAPPAATFFCIVVFKNIAYTQSHNAGSLGE